jgi:hypothetical protein
MTINYLPDEDVPSSLEEKKPLAKPQFTLTTWIMLAALVIVAAAGSFFYVQQSGYLSHQQHVIRQVASERQVAKDEAIKLQSKLAISNSAYKNCEKQSDEYLKALRDYTTVLSTWSQNIFSTPDISSVTADINAAKGFTCVPDAAPGN